MKNKKYRNLKIFSFDSSARVLNMILCCSVEKCSKMINSCIQSVHIAKNITSFSFAEYANSFLPFILTLELSYWY